MGADRTLPPVLPAQARISEPVLASCSLQPCADHRDPATPCRTALEHSPTARYCAALSALPLALPTRCLGLNSRSSALLGSLGSCMSSSLDLSTQPSTEAPPRSGHIQDNHGEGTGSSALSVAAASFTPPSGGGSGGGGRGAAAVGAQPAPAGAPGSGTGRGGRHGSTSRAGRGRGGLSRELTAQHGGRGGGGGDASGGGPPKQSRGGRGGAGRPQHDEAGRSGGGGGGGGAAAPVLGSSAGRRGWVPANHLLGVEGRGRRGRRGGGRGGGGRGPPRRPPPKPQPYDRNKFLQARPRCGAGRWWPRGCRPW